MTTIEINQSPGILCLSHLGWDFVWQRPQQILSRIAEQIPVLYINEPHFNHNSYAQAELVSVGNTPYVAAYQAVLPGSVQGTPEQHSGYVQLIESALIEQGWACYVDAALQLKRPLIIWFYTPAPVAILDSLPHSLVVYDVMDELAKFKYAHTQLPQWEQQLLQKADVVFTGGRSIYNARKDLHSNIHLFASGVDPSHFAQALDPDYPSTPQLDHIKTPILGYYGVIDERIDLQLLDTIATSYPELTIVMVGPIAKIEPQDLPHHPNIVYSGKQPYADLPAFLKTFTICLMPFAMNESTRSISPTKALEYMAAHKPIISTPVPDVVANWSEVVWIGADHVEILCLIDQVLNESVEHQQQRHTLEAAIVEHNTWDSIAQRMLEHVQIALEISSASESQLLTKEIAS